MKSAVITGNGLEIKDVPQPEAKAGEVLIKVAAAGLNRADLLALQGARGFAGGGVGGREWSGEVAALGDGVTGLAVGDRVMCTGGGAYAEYAVTVAGRAWKVPSNNMSLEQAATLPVSPTGGTSGVTIKRQSSRSQYGGCNVPWISTTGQETTP